MANINAHLPPSVALPFHPPTERLQHDNLIKPVIPKPEIVSSYTKIRDQHNSAQFSSQSHEIIQDDSQESAADSSHQEASAEKRRFHFFALRGGDFALEADSSQAQLPPIDDFNEVISVIQDHYKNSVNPFPEPIVCCSI